jgi:hypothetical protein
VIPVVLAGLSAGAVHVASGPDHYAAVLPLAVRRQGPPIAVGLSWGAGHGVGVVALVVLGQLARSFLPVTHVASGAEVLVGVALVALGLSTFRRPPHDHDHAPTRAALGFGVLHGFGGTTHLAAVLPTLAWGPAMAAAYVAGYLAAAVAVMSVVTTVAGRASRGVALPLVLRATGVLSLAVGAGWLATSVVALAG